MLTTCQTRNLLHYKHLDDRAIAEKCLLLVEDLWNRMIRDRPLLLEHIVTEFISHLLQHTSCYISLAFFLMIAKKHSELICNVLPVDKLKKMLHRIIANF